MRDISYKPTGRLEATPELISLIELQLSWLSFHALELIIQRLLTNLGYEGVRPLTRTFLRGRTDHGGVDLLATVHTPLGPVPAIVQVRHRSSPISRLDIHVLRGAMLSNAAPIGALFTTGDISPTARTTAEGYPGRPTWLVDRAALAKLLVDARLGVQESISPSSGTHRLVLVPEFFQGFEDFARRNRAGQRAGSEAA